MFGQFMWPEPLPGLGAVDGGAVVDGDAPVDGDVLVDGDAPTSGVTVGDGDVAACATTNVPNPPARPIPRPITSLAIGPRNHPRLFMLDHLPGGNAMADRHPGRAWSTLPFRTMTD
jgi:hypothetical protein